MQFFIIRSSPIFAALTFLVGAHLLRYVYQQWMFIFAGVAVIVIGYFLWVAWRLERFYFWPLMLYTLALFGVGMGSIIFLSNQLLVQLILVVWAVFALILFEAIFHYLYQTDKRGLVDLSQVINYYNGIIFFTFVIIVFNSAVFLRLNWWLSWLSVGAMASLLVFTQFRLKKVPRDMGLALLVALLCMQFVFSLHFLSLGVHVVAAIATLGFYWLVSLILANFEHILTQRRLITYSVVTALLMGAVLFSAQWL